MSNKIKISFLLNEENVATEVESSKTLAEMLREEFDLLGTKISCGEGECGACTVLLNNRAVNSCITLAAEVDGCSVLTIEGLSKNNKLDLIQQAYIDAGAVQCGYCTPGMIMSTKGLLIENPHPSEEEIKEALAGNICRCTGYEAIIDAVKKSSEMISRGDYNE